MAKSQLRLIIGIVILAVGIVVGVYGIYLYNNLQSSVMNSLEKAFVGSTDARDPGNYLYGQRCSWCCSRVGYSAYRRKAQKQRPAQSLDAQ